MVIKFDPYGKVREKFLTEEEAAIFIKFLVAERNRHSIDVININDTIKFLHEKFPGLKPIG